MPKENIAGGETAGAARGARTPDAGKSALQDKLAKLFPSEGEAAPEGAAGDDPGATRRPAGEKPEGETDDLSQTGEEETPEQIEERENAELAERAKAAGVSVDEQREAEAAEGGAGEGDGGEAGAGDPDKKYKKRVGKLLDKIEQLQTELEEATSGRPVAVQQVSEVANVFSAEKLVALQEHSEQGLEEVEGLLSSLQFAPTRVEKHFRTMAAANPEVAARFKNDAGEEDFSPEKIAEVLSGAKQDFKTTLKAIPKRQQFLDQRAKVGRMIREPEIVKLAPFVMDAESDEHEEFKALIRNSPELRNHPQGEYLAVALQIGLKQLDPAVKQIVARVTAKRGGAAPAAGARAEAGERRPSRMPGTGRPGAAAATTKLKGAREKFMKSGKLEDLDKVAAEMGM